MDVRRIVHGVGRALISTGVLMLMFVAYQLWGTNIAEARHQDQLRGDLAEVLGPKGASTPPAATEEPAAPAEPSEPAAPVEPTPAPPPPPSGEAIAMMRIPKIDVEKAVVEGVGVSDLKKGPGHYPETPMPGQPGNVAIAGHRTTYGAPFGRLDELAGGDDIVVTTRQGTFRYEVTEIRIVSPRDVGVLASVEGNRLTLTTCHPKLSARQRLVVIANLAGEAAEAPPEVIPDPDPTETPVTPRTDPATSGLSGETSPRGPALLWGVLAALIWLLTALVARAWRRVPAYALGCIAFFPALFVFFENVARLLPANV
ncbi:MAG TPA: class E sortase [Acidimicrobiales bacterium]|nr:class E sortase [Acidimicrobiales bacterium]